MKYYKFLGLVLGLLLFDGSRVFSQIASANMDVLVSAEWLEENLSDPLLLILHYGSKDDSKIIICYGDEKSIPMASRLFLTMDYAGLGDQVAILNGGLWKWKEEKRILSDSPSFIQQGNITINIKKEE